MRSNQALVTLFTSCFAFLFLLAQVTSHVPVTQWIPVLLAAVLLWEHLIIACGVQLGRDAIRIICPCSAVTHRPMSTASVR